MAIAFDAVADNAGGASGSTTVTLSHTCTGSNLILFVYARIANSAQTISGATYNGVTMTQVGSAISGDGNDNTYLFQLLGPATGANNIVVTGSSSAFIIQIRSASYNGVSQTGFPDAGPGTFGPNVTVPQTLSLTTVADNAWMVAAIHIGSGTPTMTSGTNRQATNDGTFADFGPKTPAGSTTISYTWNGSFYAYMRAVTIAPAVTTATATYTPQLLTLNVG